MWLLYSCSGLPTDWRHCYTNTRWESRRCGHSHSQKLPLQDPQCGIRSVCVCGYDHMWLHIYICCKSLCVSGLGEVWTRSQSQWSKYAFLGSFNLLLLQLEADDVFPYRTSATDEIYCVYALYSMCLCICVLVYEMSHQWRVTPSLPEAVSESLLHKGPPGPAVSQSLSSASTDHKGWAKYCAVQEQTQERTAHLLT